MNKEFPLGIYFQKDKIKPSNSYNYLLMSEEKNFHKKFYTILVQSGIFVTNTYKYKTVSYTHLTLPTKA